MARARMNFAVCSKTYHVGRIIFVAGLAFLAACSGGKGSEEKLRTLGTPPIQAFLGVEYKYDLGIKGGSGIPSVSLINAPRWMSAEYVDNSARKGVVIRGVPGISGGGADEAVVTGREPVEVGLSVFDGDSTYSMTFPLLVDSNDLGVGPVSVTEGEKSEVPVDDEGEPLTDCIVNAPGELGSTDTIAYVPVRLSAPSVQTVVASFETRQATTAQPARPGEDYLEHKGQVVIPPGTTLCYIQMIILDDEIAEDTESFDVILTDVQEGLASLGSSGVVKATVSIRDNEPKVTWNKLEIVVAEGAEVLVKGMLDQPVERLVSAEFELTPGDNDDQVQLVDQDIIVKIDGNVVSAPYYIDFHPGEQEKEVVIQVVANPDELPGPDKQFGLAWKR